MNIYQSFPFLADQVKFASERVRAGAHLSCLSFLKGGVFLAVGFSDHHLIVYYMAAADGPKRIFKSKAHSDQVDSLRFANHSARFVSGCRGNSKDGIARIWTYESQSWKNIPLRMIEEMPGQAMSSNRMLHVSEVAWSSDDRLVFTSVNENNAIKVWDSKEGQLRHVLYGHEREVFILEAHPLDPRLFLSGSFDGALILWDIDIDSGSAIKTFFDKVGRNGT